MSEKPEIELDLDLQLLPAWARQPQTANRYAQFEEGGDRDRRGPRGPGPGGPRRDFRGGDRRPDPRGPRTGGGPDRGRREDPRGGRFRGDRSDRGPGRSDAPRSEPIEELPEGIVVELIPDPTGVDSLTKQIRQTGRAYPLFDIGHLILKRPDRYLLDFRASGNLADGKPRQLYVCSLDDSVWMAEEEAVRHVLSRHLNTFYQTEKVAVEPPKGTYTFVAQCGMSGIILGPPNLHDYQTKLQRLHAERFSRLPFDHYKSRVRIVRDEAVVKQWVEEQSFKQEFVCLNVPEPLKLPSRDAVEQHFRQVHLPNIIRPVTSHVVRTPEARESLPIPLRRVARREFELQQRFPLKLVTRLSDDFAHRGLHFFKVNRTVLHVSVARPRHMDLEANPVTDGIKRILGAIDATPACTRRKLLEALGVPLPVTPPDAAAAEVPPSRELQGIVTDLHWLIHEGHVIEFANGRIETAKKPIPRPQPVPRPPRPVAPAAIPAAVPTSTEAAPETAAPSEPTSPDAVVPGAEGESEIALSEHAQESPVAPDPSGDPAPTTPEEPAESAEMASPEVAPEEGRINPS